jgi:Zn-dependent peptidase ImmA (M78 family)/transcriptional regulator with XRE-family HTH domain
MKLEVDPRRLKHLRTRIGIPLDVAATKAKVATDDLARWEEHAEPIDLEALRKLAKTYNRNWYVFLLEDEVGDPALPRDFRRLRGAGRDLSSATLLAFDDADALLQKISDLPRPGDEPHRIDLSIAGLNPEAAAATARQALGTDLRAQLEENQEYDGVRFWTKQIAKAGVYVAQLSFPYEEVRAFCRERDGIRLVVVSSKDFPRGRSFSMLHEFGHLLLGGDAMCKPRSDEAPESHPDNEEAFCNAFAAAMLMPEEQFKRDPDALAFRGRTVELGDAQALAWKYGASELAGLRRLATVGYISQENYARLQAETEDAYSGREQRSDGLRIRKQAARMVNENSRLYASEVLDAHARGDITFRDIGVLLDGNLKHYRKVREELAK